MPISRNAFKGNLGTLNPVLNTSGSIIYLDEDFDYSPAELITLTETKFAVNIQSFNVTVPTTTKVGNLLLYIAATPDGRTEQDFNDTISSPKNSWINIAAGITDISVRYKIATSGDLGQSIGIKWSGNSVGVALLLEFKNGTINDYTIFNGGTSTTFTVSPPNYGYRGSTLFFCNDQASLTVSPGLENLLLNSSASNSFYKLYIQSNTNNTVDEQLITGSAGTSDSVVAYISLTPTTSGG